MDSMETLFQDVLKLSEFGVDFSTLGVERQEFSRWRVELKKLETLVRSESESAKKETQSIQSLHASAVKPRPLPKISSLENYSRFLFIWKAEGANYKSETLKVNAIRSSITDPVDKNNTLALTSSESILAALETRWGSYMSVIKTLIQQTCSLPRPTNRNQEEETISKILSLIQVILQQNSLRYLTTENLTTLINR